MASYHSNHDDPEVILEAKGVISWLILIWCMSDQLSSWSDIWLAAFETWSALKYDFFSPKLGIITQGLSMRPVQHFYLVVSSDINIPQVETLHHNTNVHYCSCKQMQ